MPYDEKTGEQASPSPHHTVLTVNQVVSYNLARARRSRGWTQEETAERLEAASGKKWTSATLSASERAVKTGRARVFDANEVVSFSRVFEYPLAYFFLPISGKVGSGDLDILYALSRLGEQDGYQRDPLLKMMDLLDTAVPLRYPAVMIEEVNRLLRTKGVSWQPDAHISWDDGGQDDYDNWRSINQDAEDDPISLDEWQTIANFAKLMKRRSQARVLRLLADAMEQPNSEGVPLTDSPF